MKALPDKSSLDLNIFQFLTKVWKVACNRGSQGPMSKEKKETYYLTIKLAAYHVDWGQLRSSVVSQELCSQTFLTWDKCV